MIRFVLQRLLTLPPVLLAISALVFFAMRLAPGDPVQIMIGQDATPAQIQQARAALGIDKPLVQQYLVFLRSVAHGDFGRSYFGNVSVTEEVASRFPATLELSVASIAVSAALGIVMGTIAAARRGAWIDYLSRVIAVFGISMPVFWLGLMLIAIFSVKLGWLPVSGRFDSHVILEPGARFLVLDALAQGNWAAAAGAIRHLILPAAAIGTYSAAIVARFTRSAMLEVLGQDFIRTARAKGLSSSVVTLKHGLRNALIPVVTILGLQFGQFLGGAAVVETVFAWPGLGRLMVDSILQRDYPQVQASVLVLAATYVLVNLMVDGAYTMIDPRIRYE